MLSEITVVGMPSFINSHAVETRALQKRSSLVGVDVNLLALLDGGADHTQRGAVSGSGQRPGVAVGEDSAFGGHERGAVASHGLVGGDVFGVHALRFLDKPLLDVRNGTDADALELLLHAADGPEKIDRRRPGFADEVADLIEVALKVAGRFGFGIVHAEGNAHGGSHADGGRAAHHHIADHIGYLLMRLAGDVGFFGGQLRLIEEANALVGPFEGLDHASVVGR